MLGVKVIVFTESAIEIDGASNNAARGHLRNRRCSLCRKFARSARKSGLARVEKPARLSYIHGAEHKSPLGHCDLRRSETAETDALCVYMALLLNKKRTHIIR